MLSLTKGRPDVKAIINEEIAFASGDISVNGMYVSLAAEFPLILASVCGTDGLAKSVKAALCDPRPMDILRGGPNVTLHLETFGVVSMNVLVLFVILIG
jgi:ferric-chelate reductase